MLLPVSFSGWAPEMLVPATSSTPRLSIVPGSPWSPVARPVSRATVLASPV
jgi:hypothetical protein